MIGRSIMLLRRPRDLVLAVFGGVPDGLLGAMQRLGEDPIGKPETYRELLRLFASRDLADRRRVKVIGQMSGGLVGAQIEVVRLLDAVLLHPALVGKVFEIKQAHEMNHALAYLRQRCSGACDEPIRASLSRLKADDHRFTAFQAWAKRFDRLPRTLDTREDSTLVVLDTADLMIRAGHRYQNCLSKKVFEAFVGLSLYVEYRPERANEPGAIAELRSTSKGFLLEGLHAKGNCRVGPERARVIREKLASCGVALLDYAPGDDAMLEAVGNVLGLHRFKEPDNTNWSEEFDVGEEVIEDNMQAEAA